VALLVGVYEKGESTGHTEGYTDGYKIAWDTQQKAINNTVAQQNLETKQQDLKISGIEFGSMVAQSQVTKELAKAQTVRTSVITRYVQANPKAAQSCGWTPQTAQAINQILDAGETQ